MEDEKPQEFVPGLQDNAVAFISFFFWKNQQPEERDTFFKPGQGNQNWQSISISFWHLPSSKRVWLRIRQVIVVRPNWEKPSEFTAFVVVRVPISAAACRVLGDHWIVSKYLPPIAVWVMFYSYFLDFFPFLISFPAVFLSWCSFNHSERLKIGEAHGEQQESQRTTEMCTSFEGKCLA